MYGLIFETIRTIIQLEYGNDFWLALLDKAGYPNLSFCTQTKYPEDPVPKLANSAVALVADGSTVQDFLTYFGRCFVRGARTFGYETIIRSSGRYFCDFLSGIDNIHLHMRYTYHKMAHPFIYVLEEDADGVVINYRTIRKGFCPLLHGILDQVATDYYGIHLSVDKLPDKPYESNQEGYQYRIRINFDNRNYMACKTVVTNGLETERTFNLCGSPEDNRQPLAPVSNFILMQLFPFSLIFTSELKVISVGFQLKRMFPRRKLMGKILTDVARLRRPRSSLTWENLLTLQRVACELEMITFQQIEGFPHRKPGGNMIDKPIEQVAKEPHRLLLRGQMQHIEDWNSIIFLCNPLINNLDDMYELGLALSDLSLHGNGREMVMAGLQHTSRLEDLYERAEQKAADLEMTHELLDEWKQRGDDLLCSMIPSSIAQKLGNGKEPVDTCEAFESVTVLFVEITNIDDIMAKSVLEAVDCMNAVFSCLDKGIDQHNVYKVETVGKVYMVVGGAPKRNDTHVRDVSIVALRFRDEVQQLSVKSGLHVKIRIGVHTGSAVAGVLGRKMPRYCFFGDTINTAARMQTTSLPGKIQISHASYTLLQCFIGFICELRGTITVKGKGEMKTYWLLRFQQPL